MGTKSGLLVAAVGIAIAIHSHRKKQAAAVQSKPSSNYGNVALGAAGLGAAGAAAYSMHNSSSSAPAPAQMNSDGMLRDASLIYHHLVEGVLDQKLQPFYPPNANQLQMIADRIAQTGSLAAIANAWNLPPQFALDLVRLALFDVILLVDDSTSMKAGRRLQEMQEIVSEIAFCCGSFDSDGIEIRFMNSMDGGNNIRNASDVANLLSRNPPNGATPMGRSMRDKILKPLVIDRAHQGTLRKPVLVLCLTDGAANDRSGDLITTVIAQAKQELKNTRYTDNAVSFGFAQVGDDSGAIDFLNDLDDDKTVGDMIDVTSNPEYETKQVLKAMEKSSGLPPQWKDIKNSVKQDKQVWDTLFRMKRLVGGVHSWYDASDEKKQKKRWSSSHDITYKPHWSEQQDFMARTTSLHQSNGYPPYQPQQQPQYSQQPQYGQQPQFGGQQQFGQPQPPAYGSRDAFNNAPPAAGGYNAGYGNPAPSFPAYGNQSDNYSGGYPPQSDPNAFPQQPYGQQQGYNTGFPNQPAAPYGGFAQDPYGNPQQQQQQQGYQQGGFQGQGAPGGFGFPTPQY